jgi:hypothetical protein
MALNVDLTELDVILGEGGPIPAGFGANGSAVPDWLTLFAKAEQHASRAHVFEIMVIPALLQTRAYAGAIERLGHRPDSEVERIRRVDTRIARQAVLDREPDPLHLFAVIDETALGRSVGGPEVMGDQLSHLLAMLDRPNVEIRVVTGAAALPASFGTFTLLATTGGPTDLACSGGIAGVGYHESPMAVHDYAGLFDHLVDVALDVDATAALIIDYRERYR